MKISPGDDGVLAADNNRPAPSTDNPATLIASSPRTLVGTPPATSTS